MDSTISYLGSPPAQTLGIATPARAVTSDHLTVRAAPSAPHLKVPSVHSVARKEVPALSISPADPVLPLDAFDLPASHPTPRQPLPRPVSSILEESAWPLPPMVSTHTRSQSPTTHSGSSRSSSPSSAESTPRHSPSSSIDEVAGYVQAYSGMSMTPSSQYSYGYSQSHYSDEDTSAFEDLFYKPGPKTVKLELSGLKRQTSMGSVGSSGAGGRSPSLKQSLMSLRESWSRGAKYASGTSGVLPPGEGVMMTVVQETV